ncbi:MAG: helix-turn-helix domain-containing protein [Tannerellaceae bacterium]|jgi:AraC-like DNA-binding protein|nr:helix-turn-helix domain-containing protein [Tannerellaceae bacterium]
MESTGDRLGENKEDKLFYGFTVDSSSTYARNEIPQQLTGGGVFICLKGEVEFFLNLKSYKLKAGDMCVAFPFSMLQIINMSDDFDGFGIRVSVELFIDIRIPSSTDYYLYIKDNPCISLSDDELRMLTGLCRRMMQGYDRIDHPFRMEIANNMFRIICYEITAIYKKGEPIAQQSILRKDMLFRKFLSLMAQNWQQYRDVDYYARKLCVTPRYLSSVIKEKSGASALGWINATVIRQAKGMLKDRRLSVQQIADKLNFANPSFFGQYFKKHTGMTPKKFRDKEG